MPVKTIVCVLRYTIKRLVTIKFFVIWHSWWVCQYNVLNDQRRNDGIQGINDIDEESSSNIKVKYI